jgi:hypothetical protein
MNEPTLKYDAEGHIKSIQFECGCGGDVVTVNEEVRCSIHLCSRTCKTAKWFADTYLSALPGIPVDIVYLDEAS